MTLVAVIQRGVAVLEVRRRVLRRETRALTAEATVQITVHVECLVETLEPLDEKEGDYSHDRLDLPDLRGRVAPSIPPIRVHGCDKDSQGNGQDVTVDEGAVIDPHVLLPVCEHDAGWNAPDDWGTATVPLDTTSTILRFET